MNALARKTVLGFIQLLTALGILLLVPAWTFDYWQAWVYLSVFIASSALITACLWKKANREGECQRGVESPYFHTGSD